MKFLFYLVYRVYGSSFFCGVRKEKKNIKQVPSLSIWRKVKKSNLFHNDSPGDTVDLVRKAKLPFFSVMADLTTSQHSLYHFQFPMLGIPIHKVLNWDPRYYSVCKQINNKEQMVPKAIQHRDLWSVRFWSLWQVSVLNCHASRFCQTVCYFRLAPYLNLV